MNDILLSKELLAEPVAGNHYAQAYEDSAGLVDIVCHFIGNELGATEAAIVIATDAHMQAISKNLGAQGMDVQELQRTGQLTLCRAETLLNGYMRHGQPDTALFFSTMTPIFNQVYKRYKHTRVYGEMVDILWQQGNQPAAMRLEEYWNSILKSYSLSLLCAYKLDTLDEANYSGAIDCVCKMHTHFLPSYDLGDLDKAVSHATKDCIGMDLSSTVYSNSSLGHPTTLMPAAQASLLYVSKTMPSALAGILSSVRSKLNESNLNSPN